MKRIAYLLAAAALLILPSCRFVRVSDEMLGKFKDEISGEIEFNGDDTGRDVIIASDSYITRNDVTGEFHSLQCNVPGDVIYTPGDCAVSLNGPDNVVRHILIDNNNGTLVIKTDGVTVRKLKKFTINISSPVLEEAVFNGAVDFSAARGITALDFNVVVNGAGDVEIAGLKADKAAITVNGAGDIDVEKLDCERLSVAVNGAGDAVVSGKAAAASLTISGAGDIDVSALQCPEIESKVRGIGSIKRP